MREQFPKPYRLADLVLKRLNKQALRRTDAAKNKLSLLKFDELNVMKEVDVLYKDLISNDKKAFEQIYRERYREIWLFLKGKEPDEDKLDELVEMFLTGILYKPQTQTKYIFDTEAIRKRDRAKEAILSSPTRAQKQIELDKAVRYFQQQTAFYVDLSEDYASRQALEDGGVGKVRWMIYGDDRVCSECEALNGTVWDIDKVPEKPHLRCRCWLKPVT